MSKSKTSMIKNPLVSGQAYTFDYSKNDISAPLVGVQTMLLLGPHNDTMKCETGDWLQRWSLVITDINGIVSVAENAYLMYSGDGRCVYGMFGHIYKRIV